MDWVPRKHLLRAQGVMLYHGTVAFLTLHHRGCIIRFGALRDESYAQLPCARQPRVNTLHSKGYTLENVFCW